jgi:hypothetical protein
MLIFAGKMIEMVIKSLHLFSRKITEMNSAEVQELLQRVHKRHKTLCLTSKGFEDLSRDIMSACNEMVSSSTLKRLWNYVGDVHEVRESTLDILSRYVGFDNYQAFLNELKKSPQRNSYFFTRDEIKASELTAGDRVQIGWAPNRIVIVEYLGDMKFRVEASENSKLEVGDTFLINSFLINTPLYLTTLVRKDLEMPPYLAGRNGGLTILKKL